MFVLILHPHFYPKTLKITTYLLINKNINTKKIPSCSLSLAVIFEWNIFYLLTGKQNFATKSLWL